MYLFKYIMFAIFFFFFTLSVSNKRKKTASFMNPLGVYGQVILGLGVRPCYTCMTLRLYHGICINQTQYHYTRTF